MLPMLPRRPRTLAVLALCVALLSGCAGTATTTSAPEETFISTAIAVIAPTPAHPGDPVTVIVKPAPAYQPGSPQYYFVFTGGLYGPFPSLASEQNTIATSTVGPPAWQNQISIVRGSGIVSNGGDFVAQTTTTLPRTLAPGYYDFAVTLTLSGSRATARSDTVVQVVV